MQLVIWDHLGLFQTPFLDSRIHLWIPKLGLRFQNSCLDSKTCFSIPKLTKTHQTIVRHGGITGPPFATLVYCFASLPLSPFGLTVFLYAVVHSGLLQTPILDSRIYLWIPKLGLRFQNCCRGSKHYFSIPKLAKIYQRADQHGG